VRASRIVLKGEVDSRSEANVHLVAAGDAVIVRRQVLRSIALACPDACGDVLTINLDARAGRAWRLYTNDRRVTLWPSVWRDSGCCSHFIIWNGLVIWCDSRDAEWHPTFRAEVKEAILSLLSEDTWKTVLELADSSGQSPWDVAEACRELSRSGKAVRSTGRDMAAYKRSLNRRDVQPL
jgi:hypothetical protein